MIYVGDDHKKIGHILYEGNEVILGVINGKIVYQIKGGISFTGDGEVNTYDYGEYYFIIDGKRITTGFELNVEGGTSEDSYEILDNKITFKEMNTYKITTTYKGIPYEVLVAVSDITLTLS